MLDLSEDNSRCANHQPGAFKGILAILMLCVAMLMARSNAADIRNFEVTWSGAVFGNNAAATAQISIDLDQVNNPGTTSGVDWVSDFSITVTGAVKGNGTWPKAQIGDFRLRTGSLPLDFTNELVGQNGWATQSSTSRDFALLGSLNGAPVSSDYFTLRVDKGYGEPMKLTSFRPLTSDSSLVLQPDFGLDHGRGVDGEVYALGEDSSGRLIVGGRFYVAGDVDSPGVARFLKNGEVDPQFQTGSGVTGTVLDLTVLPDDSMVIVGEFTYFNGTYRPNIVKVLPNGMVDETFASDIHGAFGTDAAIRCIKQLPDGKFIIGGKFRQYGGVFREHIARLDANGALDLSFDTGGGFESYLDFVNQIQLLDGGQILAAGSFSGYRAHHTENVVRIQPDGDVDTTFLATGIAVDVVETMTVLSTGKILVGGTDAGRMLCLLHENGEVDETFDPDVTGHAVYGVTELPSGKILVSGEIENHSGPYFSNLLVLESNGVLDPNGFSGRVTPNQWAGPLLQAADNSIYVGGAFTTINDILPYGHLARFVDSSTRLPDVWFHSATGTSVEGRSTYFEVDVGGFHADPVDFQVTVEADDPGVLSRVSVSSILTVFPGDTKAWISAYILNNLEINGPWSFRLRITALTGGTAVGSPNVMTVTVQDDDVPGTVFLESASGVVNEGRDSLPVRIKRFLNDPGAVSVRLRSVDGTALAGRDYQAIDTVVDFPVGVYEKTVNIGGPPSTPDENPLRRFTVELYNPAVGALLGSPKVASIDVNDKDDPGSSLVDYTIPDPSLLVRFVDLALDADGVLYGLAYYSLGSPSAIASKIIRFSSSGEGQVFAVVPTGGQYRWADDLAFGLDGKLYVSGSGFVLRYLPNGSIDDTWTNPIAYDVSLPTTLQCMLPMPDGKLMIAGRIIDPIDGLTRWQVARIMPNGSLDPSFDLGEILPVGSATWIYDMARDRSGALLIAGTISSIQGKPRLNVVRVFADGTLDESFDATTAISNRGLSQAVTRVSVAPDGKIYLAGPGVIRVNANGALDTGFPLVSGNKFALQPDGKLVVFSTNTYLLGKRYDSTGQPDDGFRPYNMNAGSAYAVELGSDGQIHCAGAFTSFDGVPAPGVVTLKGGSGSAAGKIGWDGGRRSLGEGIGQKVATLQRLNSSSGNVGVHYTLVPETAGVGTDAKELSGYHEFLPGETEHTITFEVLDDGIPEETESFRLVLHDPSGGAQVADPGHLDVDIVDDDGSDVAAWIARYFPTKPLDLSVLNEDPDGDGMKTFAEWMTDSDPTRGSDVKNPQPGWHVVATAGEEENHFGVSFYVDSSKPGFRAVVERNGSLDEESWSAIWDSAADPQMESDLIQEHPAAGVGWMSVRSPDAVGTKEFLRVRYEASP